MQRSRTFRYLPLIAFLVVYLLSCVVGALLIIGGDRQFIALFEYFSGTKPPALTASEKTTDLLLLFAAPAALCAGYAAVAQLPRLRKRRQADEATAPATSSTAPWVAHAVFWLVAAGGVVSLAHGGALGRAHSWFDYGSWIHARSANFQNLNFAEFVNLYVLVPTAAAWVVVATRGRGLGWQIARWLPPILAVAFTLLLYMRKAAIVVILLVAFAWIIDLSRRRLRGVPWLVAGTIVTIGALYFAVVVAPVYSKASHAVAQAQSVANPSKSGVKRAHDVTVSQPQLKELAKQIGFHTRSDSLLVYALASPLTRSSAPALWYPVIFPQRHPYYRVDLGQDILGVGTMPDDNIVVWNYLNPNLPGGTEMVPYQFVLYSQGGTALAVGLSLIVGALLAAIWMFTQSDRIRRPWGALLGSLTVLLAVYVGLDSLRNSVLVSYGVIWGFIFVGLIAVVAHVVRQARTSRPSLLSRRTSRAEAR